MSCWKRGIRLSSQESWFRLRHKANLLSYVTFEKVLLNDLANICRLRLRLPLAYVYRLLDLLLADNLIKFKLKFLHRVLAVPEGARDCLIVNEVLVPVCLEVPHHLGVYFSRDTVPDGVPPEPVLDQGFIYFEANDLEKHGLVQLHQHVVVSLDVFSSKLKFLLDGDPDRVPYYKWKCLQKRVIEPCTHSTVQLEVASLELFTPISNALDAELGSRL